MDNKSTLKHLKKVFKDKLLTSYGDRFSSNFPFINLKKYVRSLLLWGKMQVA